MKILISSVATSYTISGRSLHLRVSFSQFTKQAVKSLLRKAASLDSSTSESTERSSPVPPRKCKTFLCRLDLLPDINFTPFMRQLR